MHIRLGFLVVRLFDHFDEDMNIGVRGSLEQDISSLRALGLGVGQISRVVHVSALPRFTSSVLLLSMEDASCVGRVRGTFIHFAPDLGHTLRKNRSSSVPPSRSEGFPGTGYFVPACVGSGRWADFESCSRIHACGFRCFCWRVVFACIKTLLVGET